MVGNQDTSVINQDMGSLPKGDGISVASLAGAPGFFG